jgi:hypothetical protein
MDDDRLALEEIRTINYGPDGAAHKLLRIQRVLERVFGVFRGGNTLLDALVVR